MPGWEASMLFLGPGKEQFFLTLLFLGLSLEQIMEENKEHGALVSFCHVLQEEVPLDPAGRTRR